MSKYFTVIVREPGEKIFGIHFGSFSKSETYYEIQSLQPQYARRDIRTIETKSAHQPAIDSALDKFNLEQLQAETAKLARLIGNQEET